jgi:hypothetical protein
MIMNDSTRKSEALDVEKVEEYVSMVEKIHERHLSKASIIVDSEDIKRSVCNLLICVFFD